MREHGWVGWPRLDGHFVSGVCRCCAETKPCLAGYCRHCLEGCEIDWETIHDREGRV